MAFGNRPGKQPAVFHPAPKVDQRHRIGVDEWLQSGKWVRVKSSNVGGISYDVHNNTLFVEFLNGGTYAYYQVPPQTAKEMFMSTSMGKFLHKKIKGVYAYAKV